MQQLQYVRKGVLEWGEVPAPELSGGDALVRPLSIARCDLDLPMLRGETLLRPPFPFGHEFTAEITELADDVQGFQIGQRVIVPFQISCGSCPRCRRHSSQNCSSVDFTSAYGLGRISRQWGGAFQESIRVPFATAMLVAMPEGIDPGAIASISDNISDAWRTVAPFLQADRDQSTLVLAGGAHSIALYAVQIAAALGSPHITYVDSSEERRRHAERLGAVAITMEEFQGTHPQADIVVEATGNAERFPEAVRAVAPGGSLTPVSIFFQNDLPLPYLEMYNKSVQLNIGRVSSREIIPQALALIEKGALQPQEVTTRRVSWKQAADALLEESVKLVLDCDPL
ncbi:MAG: alcohol dehydrogenase catalytic domain-containing protein [Leptospirales bacterium]|nr:alcohol dehydrogenase catalytic domain-containing protein [Leptospirales bacterium]